MGLGDEPTLLDEPETQQLPAIADDGVVIDEVNEIVSAFSFLEN